MAQWNSIPEGPLKEDLTKRRNRILVPRSQLDPRKMCLRLTTLVVFGVDGLFECGYVAECEEKENHQVSLVPYRRHLKQEP